MQIQVYHQDDADLTVRVHDSYLKKNTTLDPEDVIGRVQIFARILFNNILNSDRREFTLIKNEETDEWEYLVPAKDQ